MAGKKIPDGKRPSLEERMLAGLELTPADMHIRSHRWTEEDAMVLKVYNSMPAYERATLSSMADALSNRLNQGIQRADHPRYATLPECLSTVLKCILYDKVHQPDVDHRAKYWLYHLVDCGWGENVVG